MTVKAKAGASGPHIVAEAGGRQFVLEREADLETLWQEMTENPSALEDERLPYWTELWPAALVLADWLCAQKALLGGRKCLDIGCGLGFLSILGDWLGARMLGMDYEADALAFCRKNAFKNGQNPAFVLMDWRRPAIARGVFDFVWGADIMYEARFTAPVADFLAFGLAGSGIAWLADPCRNFFAKFQDDLRERGLLARLALEEDTGALYPQPARVPVRIWEISRIPEAGTIFRY